MAGSAVSIKKIVKAFGATPVLDQVELDVEPGEFLTLLGPSGCGKSTLLRLIAGFESQSSGTIEIEGKSVDGLRPKERGLSMVFQNYALYPHLSVFENIAMPLVMRRLSFAQRFPGVGRYMPGSKRILSDISETVRRTAALLELDELLDRRPGQLSGGQRQRVALGRALAAEPSVFLMDEPLSNLDARLRTQMRNELTELHSKLGITFIYVTHDQIEAMTMSQRVAVMMEGDLLQIGTPSEIYAQPVDLRVARFIGTHPINVYRASLQVDGAPQLFGRSIAVQLPLDDQSQISVAVRPEDLLLTVSKKADAATPDGNLQIGAHLEKLEDHGAEFLLHLRLKTPSRDAALVRGDAALREQLTGLDNADLSIAFPTERLLFFDAEGRRLHLEDAVPEPLLQSGSMT